MQEGPVVIDDVAVESSQEPLSTIDLGASKPIAANNVSWDQSQVANKRQAAIKSQVVVKSQVVDKYQPETNTFFSPTSMFGH